MADQPDNARVYDFAAAYAHKRGGDPLEPWLTKPELAKRIRKSERWIEQTQKAHADFPVTYFGRSPRYKAGAVDAWFEKRRAS